MGRLAGLFGYFLVAHVVELRQVAGGNQVQEPLVPLRVKRVQRVLVVHKLAGGVDHPSGTKLPLIFRQVTTTAQEAVFHVIVSGGQFRYRWLVRQTTGTDDQHSLVQGSGPAAQSFTQKTGSLERR